MKTVNVVAAVIRDSDKNFATARGYGEYKGWWEFPGGKIEAGETPEEALVREIREELESEIEVGEYIDSDLCYESLMALGKVFKTDSVPELKAVKDIEKARRICSGCVYSDLE